MAAPRVPLFQTQTPTLKSNETDESKKGLPQAVVAVIVAGIVIAVAYAYYDDCPPEDSLAGKC